MIARGRESVPRVERVCFCHLHCCCESTNKRRKKNRQKSVEYFLFYAFYVTHTHKHTDAHTLTENMRGKFSRFENKAEKCRKKLAIGLTLPNKLTRFRCDAEYQSPRTTATATQGPVSILAGMESDTRRATRHEARMGQNTVGSCGNHCACVMAHGLQQQSDVSLTPATVRVIPSPSPTHFLTPF